PRCSAAGLSRAAISAGRVGGPQQPDRAPSPTRALAASGAENTEPPRSGVNYTEDLTWELQQVVENLAPGCPYPPPRERVSPAAIGREVDDLHAFAAEDLIEAGRELGVAVAEQEMGPDVAILEEPRELADLLDDPGAGGRGGAAGEMHAAAADLQEEEDM